MHMTCAWMHMCMHMCMHMHTCTCHVHVHVATYLSRRVTQQSCSHGVPRPDSLFSALVGSGPAAERLHAIAEASARRGVSVQLAGRALKSSVVALVRFL